MVSISLDFGILNEEGWRYVDDAAGAFATGPVCHVYGVDDEQPTQATLCVVRVGERREDHQDLVMLQLDEDLLPQYSDDHVEVTATIDDEFRCILQARKLSHAHAPVFEASKHLIALLKVTKKIVFFLHLHDGAPVAAQFKLRQPLNWDEIRWIE